MGDLSILAYHFPALYVRNSILCSFEITSPNYYGTSRPQGTKYEFKKLRVIELKVTQVQKVLPCNKSEPTETFGTFQRIINILLKILKPYMEVCCIHCRALSTPGKWHTSCKNGSELHVTLMLANSKVVDFLWGLKLMFSYVTLFPNDQYHLFERITYTNFCLICG